MKLSAVYALSNGAGFKYALRGELVETLKSMAELGYQGVEYSISNPFAVDFKALLKTTEDYGLRISAISTGLAYLEHGLTITHMDRSIREEALKFMEKYVEHASAHGSGVVVGLIRGRRDRRSVEETTEVLIDAIRSLEKNCRSFNVPLLLEPLNRYETDYINNVSDALRIISQVGDYVKLLFDIFHMSIEESSVYEAILKAGSNIGHVHIAENNRLPPKMGSIDWERIIFRLLRVGYKGYLSLEALPKPSFNEALKLTVKTINPLISALP